MLNFEQYESFSGSDHVFPIGYTQLITKLSEGLNIPLKEEVNFVNYQHTPIIVTTNQSQYQSRFVLCTVPLGVLQKETIQFNPALPLAQKKAFSKLAMGILDKVYLQFPYVFWDKNADDINLVPEQNFPGLEITNLFKLKQNPALMAFISGNEALKMEQESESSEV